jgi:Family of unknown function (DUF6350)
MTRPKLTSRGVRRGVPDGIRQSLLATAAWTGVGAAIVCATVGVCIAVACWLPDAGVSGSPVRAMRAGVLGFLAAHHGGVTIDGTPVQFVPMGATLVVVVVVWHAGSVLAQLASQIGETRASRLCAAICVQAISYGTTCIALSSVATLGTSSASGLRVGIAATGLAGLVAGASLCCSSRCRRWWRVSLAHVVVLGGRAVAAACALLIGSGAVLLAGSLVVHGGRVMRLSSLVGGGISGAAVTVMGLLSAPNGAIAAAGYVAGPGFAIGSGTTFTPLSSGHGTVPAFPLFGALPSGNGGNRIVLAWVALTLLALAFVATWLLGRARPAEALRALLLAAAASGLGMAALCWLAGGSLGTDRLRTVGPSPLRVGGSVALEVLLPALVLLPGVWLCRWLRSLLARRLAKPEDAVRERPLAAVGVSDED